LGGIRARVDTRSKILSRAAAERLAGPLTLATGYFDGLSLEHIHELDQARRPVLAAVLRHPGELFPATARAEMAAALRVIDYVVTAHPDELGELIERLHPAAVLRLEAADLRRARRLKEDAERRQIR
jgi:glycerol-3-phosphate cytidylyltransferase-like family protein